MAHTVWVVDDEPLIRTAVLAVLSEVGYTARGFGNAEELYLALVEEGATPDLLVLDQRLPDEFGSTILHSLRERPQYRDIPVLFVTAIDDEEADRLTALAPVIRKPFDFSDLVAAVEGELARIAS
ncbi:MAG TPA: response regulator [Vitreimonas sp.]|jgi:two-component system, OmpR family, alkaline phosphatase synthesis response regulator PhoP|nr:response regulator [Vitreimonas sp.]